MSYKCKYEYKVISNISHNCYTQYKIEHDVNYYKEKKYIVTK